MKRKDNLQNHLAYVKRYPGRVIYNKTGILLTFDLYRLSSLT